MSENKWCKKWILSNTAYVLRCSWPHWLHISHLYYTSQDCGNQLLVGYTAVATDCIEAQLSGGSRYTQTISCHLLPRSFSVGNEE